jgi:hypothetical protein
MTAHLTDEQIQCYRDRSLAAADLLEASAHLADCEACRTRVASLAELRSAIDSIRAGLTIQHPTYDEMAAHVDGHESDFVESHVRECEPCAADLHELQRLQEEIAAGQVKRRSWRFRLPVPIFAVAATAAAALVVAVLLIPRKPNEIARVQTPTPPKSADNKIAGLDLLAAADRVPVEQTLASGRIEPPAVLAQLTGKRGVLLGSSPEAPAIELIAPLGTVVESQRPVFRWMARKGDSYLMSVYDTAFNVVASIRVQVGGMISETTAEWQPQHDLRRGERYQWQVKVRRNGKEFTVPAPPQPEARFQVLGAAEEEDIARLRSQVPDSHLVLGIRYVQVGLLDDAARELQAAPESPTTAALLKSLEQMRQSR